MLNVAQMGRWSDTASFAFVSSLLNIVWSNMSIPEFWLYSVKYSF